VLQTIARGRSAASRSNRAASSPGTRSRTSSARLKTTSVAGISTWLAWTGSPLWTERKRVEWALARSEEGPERSWLRERRAAVLSEKRARRSRWLTGYL